MTSHQHTEYHYSALRTQHSALAFDVLIKTFCNDSMPHLLSANLNIHSSIFKEPYATAVQLLTLILQGAGNKTIAAST